MLGLGAKLVVRRPRMNREYGTLLIDLDRRKAIRKFEALIHLTIGRAQRKTGKGSGDQAFGNSFHGWWSAIIYLVNKTCSKSCQE